MSTQVAINCPKCDNSQAYSIQRLAQHLGKSLRLKCKACSNIFQHEITAKLLNPAPVQRKQIPTDNLERARRKTKLSTRDSPAEAMRGSVARIRVTSNENGVTDEFTLKKGTLLIGRKKSSSPKSEDFYGIPTNDSFMSGKHCRLTLDIDGMGNTYVFIADANSTNGTFITQEGAAERRLYKDEEVALGLSDKVRIGHSTLELN